MIAKKLQAKPTALSYPKGHPLEYISASRVICWQGCRRKFYFRYVEKLPSIPSPALHVGKTVHAALETWNNLRWDKIEFEESVIYEAYMKAWLAPDADIVWDTPEVEKKAFDQGWLMIQTYLKETPVAVGEPILGVEVRVDAKLPGLPPIMGFVDLVRNTPEGGKVVDFKTAAKSPSEKTCAFTHSTQLGIYSLLYRANTGEKEAGLELHHLIKTKVPKIAITEIDPITDVQMEQLHTLLHTYVKAVQDEDFTASPTFMCGSCEYLEQCKGFQSKQKQEGGVPCVS